MYEIRITDLDELKYWQRTEWTKLDHIVIVTAIRQRRRRQLQISYVCFVHLLAIFSTRCYQMNSIWWIWRPQLSRINSGVSSCNKSMVARAQWAFQVSQGSVETLFRRGEKRLHHVTGYLFRKLCAKFHRNRPSFVGDITENIWSLFFRTWCICVYQLLEKAFKSYKWKNKYGKCIWL